MENRELFAKLIQMPPAALRESDESEWSNLELKIYRRVLIAEDLQDLSQLQALSDEISQGVNKLYSQELALVSVLRAAIMAKSIDLEMLARAEVFVISLPLDDPWYGEMTFVCAEAFAVFQDFHRARQMYERAQRGLHESGAPKKALRAFFNSIKSEHRTDARNSKQFLIRFHAVSAKAKQLGDLDTAGLALLSMANEYQAADAFVLALQYANRALELLSADIDSLNYELALVSRCLLLIALGRCREAEVDEARLAQSRFIEIQDESKKIQQILSLEKSTGFAKKALPSLWEERLVGKKKAAPTTGKLADLEEQLIRLLSAGPCDKISLIQKLYGEQLSYDVVDNRFKSLVNRFRKKNPGLLLHAEGKYFLADRVVVAQ